MNKEERKRYNREYFLKNKDHINKRSRDRYKKDKSKVVLRNKRYRDKYRQKCLEKQRIYSRSYKRKPLTKDQKEHNKKYKHEWYLKNKEKYKKKFKLYNKENKNMVKNNDLKKKYNITLDDYNNKLIQQDFKCAICFIDLTILNSKHVHVDHDHIYNIVRDILCHCCNKMIGMAKENISILENGIKYLEKWRLHVGIQSSTN